jgi:chromosome segregation ATPase
LNFQNFKFYTLLFRDDEPVQTSLDNQFKNVPPKQTKSKAARFNDEQKIAANRTLTKPFVSNITTTNSAVQQNCSYAQLTEKINLEWAAKEQKILSHNSELEKNFQESQKNLSKCTQSEASLYANEKELQKTVTELTANCTVCNNYITFLTSNQQNQNEKLTSIQLTLQNCTSQLESIKHNFTVVNSNLQSFKLDYESRLESLTDNVTLCYVTTNNTVYQLQHRLQSVQQNLSNCTSQRDTLYIQEQ